MECNSGTRPLLRLQSLECWCGGGGRPVEVLVAYIITYFVSIWYTIWHCIFISILRQFRFYSLLLFILIGDHLQLWLSTTVCSWEGSTNQISLFLRMIEHEMKPCVLIVQHQMRPELAHLTLPAFYPELQNHLLVERYPNLPEMKPNVFFLTLSLGKGGHVGRGKPQ